MAIRETGKKIGCVARRRRLETARHRPIIASTAYSSTFVRRYRVGNRRVCPRRCDEVREQLAAAVVFSFLGHPLSGGRNRVALDALLRDLARQGVWSARNTPRSPQDWRQGSPTPHEAVVLGNRTHLIAPRARFARVPLAFFFSVK